MPDNPYGSRHGLWVLNAASGVNGRPAVAAFKNNVFENIYDSQYPPLWIGSIPIVPAFMENNIFRNCSSQEWLVRIEGVPVTVQNDTIENSVGNKGFILYMYMVPYVSVKNLTLSNINALATSLIY